MAPGWFFFFLWNKPSWNKWKSQNLFEMGVTFQTVSTFGEQAISYEKFRYVTCGELFIFRYRNFWSFPHASLPSFQSDLFCFNNSLCALTSSYRFHSTSRVPSRTTVIDVRVIPLHHRSPTQSEETTGKLRRHVSRTKDNRGMETRARCRPLVARSVVKWFNKNNKLYCFFR